jgi:hypothetical protein
LICGPKSNTLVILIVSNHNLPFFNYIFYISLCINNTWIKWPIEFALYLKYYFFKESEETLVTEVQPEELENNNVDQMRFESVPFLANHITSSIAIELGATSRNKTKKEELDKSPQHFELNQSFKMTSIYVAHLSANNSISRVIQTACHYLVTMSHQQNYELILVWPRRNYILYRYSNVNAAI